MKPKAKGTRSKYGSEKVWRCEFCQNEYAASFIGGPCVFCGGEVLKFDSKKEANRWLELKLLERVGKIRNLRRQVKFHLYAANPHLADPSQQIKIRSDGYPNGRRATWTADFEYVEDGEIVIEDCKSKKFKNGKSTATEASRLRMGIVEAMLGTRIRIS